MLRGKASTSATGTCNKRRLSSTRRQNETKIGTHGTDLLSSFDAIGSGPNLKKQMDGQETPSISHLRAREAETSKQGLKRPSQTKYI
jgi:hypothetical protein